MDFCEPRCNIKLDIFLKFKDVTIGIRALAGTRIEDRPFSK
jgi:hypothetical protein